MNSAVGGISLDDVSEPQAVPLLFEADAPIRSFHGGMRDISLGRHYGQTNTMFLDGHARTLTSTPNETFQWTPKKQVKSKGE